MYILLLLQINLSSVYVTCQCKFDLSSESENWKHHNLNNYLSSLACGIGMT